MADNKALLGDYEEKPDIWASAVRSCSLDTYRVIIYHQHSIKMKKRTRDIGPGLTPSIPFYHCRLITKSQMMHGSIRSGNR